MPPNNFWGPVQNEDARSFFSLYMCMLSHFSHVQLFATNPMDCSPSGSSVHGILQARILEPVAMPSCRGSSGPWDQAGISYISCIGRRVLYHWRHLIALYNIYFIYLFIFGCPGSSLQWAAHCIGFSCCRSGALGTLAQYFKNLY